MSAGKEISSGKIKVMYIFAALPVGGAEEVLLTEVEGLDKKTFDPFVCVISEKGPIGEQIEKTGVRVIPLHRMGKSQFDYRIIRNLYTLMRREGVHVVHTHLYDGNKYGRLAAILARVPCIVSTYQNVYVRRRLKYHLINWALSAVNDRILAGSEAVKESVMRYDRIGAGKIQVLYNAIDPAKFRGGESGGDVRRRFGIKAEDFLIGVIARLEEQKGHIYVLQAMSQVVRNYRAVKVLVVGDGKLRSFLQERTRTLGLSDFVLFAGTQRPTDPILRALDLFLLPSLWEGFSISILEAMAMGVPVVATAVGGASEVITSGKDGLLIQPGDVGSLTAAIEDSLLHRDKFRQMGKNGKETVIRNFTKANHLAMLQSLYLEVLGKKGVKLYGAGI
jgi:glycosyltransferase involved in cell wall biosynthesis